jgi:hypothetical protein
MLNHPVRHFSLTLIYLSYNSPSALVSRFAGSSIRHYGLTLSIRYEARASRLGANMGGCGWPSCPFCMVMLGDAVNAKQAAGQAKQSLEVIDVSQLLVRSIKLREGAVPGDGA